MKRLYPGIRDPKPGTYCFRLKLKECDLFGSPQNQIRVDKSSRFRWCLYPSFSARRSVSLLSCNHPGQPTFLCCLDHRSWPQTSSSDISQLGFCIVRYECKFLSVVFLLFASLCEHPSCSQGRVNLGCLGTCSATATGPKSFMTARMMKGR